MIVCITEKPSVAKDVAEILGARDRRDGFFEGNGYCVTWTFGHLCELKEPQEYTERWKRWALSALPMIPPRFSIKLKKDKGIEHQFAVIKNLVAAADEVINCGDAGQEGELIQRWVLQKAGIQCPVKRLWISSLTDEAIRNGFSALKPQSDFDNLYYAGLSRAIGDWVLGMNATRLYSLKYSRPGAVLSVGRVQTPTLALVVQRQLEIDNFKPENFWELTTTYREVTFRSLTGRYSEESKALEAAGSISGLPFTITDVEKKKGKEAPPRLFDLTSLQVECNKLWGWSADITLRLIQTLYEKKVTTYPRVDTTYLSDDLYPKIPQILRQMTPYESVIEPLLQSRLPKPKRIFDNSKVTDHHAIIPTGQSPKVLDGDEKKLYHLIAMRFLASFYPDCQFLATNVIGKAGDIAFKTSGKVIDKPGWRVLFKKKDAENAEKDEEKILPDFVVGESGPHKPEVATRQTQPPKPYTEGTLLRAMETCGKFVDDEELREAMKANGIGRPSTRAAIIETLFKRGYLDKRKKSLVATPAGIELIATIKDELLKSAKLTGIWENKLRRIESGDYSPATFLEEIKEMISRIVNDVMHDNVNRRIETNVSSSKPGDVAVNVPEKKTAKRRKPIRSIEEIECPHCGKGHLLKGRTGYGCSRYKEGCGCVLPFTEFPADLKPAALRTLINKKLKKK